MTRLRLYAKVWFYGENLRALIAIVLWLRRMWRGEMTDRESVAWAGFVYEAISSYPEPQVDHWREEVDSSFVPKPINRNVPRWIEV